MLKLDPYLRCKKPALKKVFHPKLITVNVYKPNKISHVVIFSSFLLSLKSNTDIISILTRDQNINNMLNQDFRFNSIFLDKKKVLWKHR